MTTEWMRPRTPRSIAGLAAVAAVAGALWVSSLAAQDNAEKPAVPEVLARVGGEAIDRDAVMKEASKSLDDVAAERFQCQQAADRNEHEAVKTATERVVHRRLFALEAERRGMTEDALRSELKGQAGEVTDAEVDAFYEANRAQIQQPKEQIAQQIRDYLRQQRLQQADTEFFAEMEKNFKVDYLLEPLRVEVAASGSARGPANAPVTIVEFSDFQCPYCKRVVPTLDQVAAKYGDQVRVVYRQFPLLSIHPEAQKAAEASLCAADQGKFWEMHDLLFNEQQKLAVADLKEKATRLGLDTASFGECLDSGRQAETVAADLEDGAAAGVSGTPAFFINGRFLNGAVPFENMAELIDDEIRRSQRD